MLPGPTSAITRGVSPVRRFNPQKLLIAAESIIAPGSSRRAPPLGRRATAVSEKTSFRMARCAFSKISSEMRRGRKATS
jgi:hypothetical protein